MPVLLKSLRDSQRANSRTANSAVRAMRAEQREEARRADRAARAAARKRTRRAIGVTVRRAAPPVGAAVPVAMVNATAFVGQFAYIRDHVPWTLPGQVLVAATFELVAVYLAGHAHLAKMKNDSATRLVIGAQLFALVMGLMNYSHYADHWRPTVMAVGLGLMSLMSPLLWGVYSRRASRDRLMAQGLVEPHAVRLGGNRWTWHPWRSVQVMWLVTWVGENDPKRAIALYEEHQDLRRATRAARQQELAARRDKDGTPGLAHPERQHVPAGAVPSQVEASQHASTPALSAAVPVGVNEDGRTIYVGAPGLVPAQPPAGPRQVIPGTELNGRQVGAIVPLAAKPTMNASHPIDPARIGQVAQYLAGLPVSDLPGRLKLGRMLCDEHDHRRQADPLLAERRRGGPDPLPAFVQPRRLSSVNGSATTAIATPVGTMPGGAPANG